MFKTKTAMVNTVNYIYLLIFSLFAYFAGIIVTVFFVSRITPTFSQTIVSLMGVIIGIILGVTTIKFMINRKW